jgi:hypothetical protein
LSSAILARFFPVFGEWGLQLRRDEFLEILGATRVAKVRRSRDMDLGFPRDD